MKYCFIGFPLSGKSTLARKLAEKLGVECVSTGDIARNLGMGLEDSIKSKDLSVKFDGEITKRALDAIVAGKVLDGFPRSIEQIEKLKELGVEYKIIFVTENPLVIYDRTNERARESGRPEDIPEIVSGRLRASLSFLKKIISTVDNVLVFPSRCGFEELEKELNI